MGFWGAFVVHRSESLLTELLPDVEEVRNAELAYDGGAEGWQVTRLFIRNAQLPDDFLARLQAATGAPVLVCAVMDSSYGFVGALGSRGGWQAWLQLDQAIGYLDPPPAPFDEAGNFLGSDWTDPGYAQRTAELKARILADVPGGVVAATAAVAWAREAGLEPESVDAVAATLDGNQGIAEDRFFELIAKLGIATADEAGQPRRPPAVIDVTRSRFGHSLEALATTRHQPVRGERRYGPDMPDLLLCFDDQRTTRACACTGEFLLRPDSDHAEDVEPVAVDAVGRRLVDAATIRQGVLPRLRGMVLYFEDDHNLFIAAHDGAWTIADGASPPRELIDRVGRRFSDKFWINSRMGVARRK